MNTRQELFPLFQAIALGCFSLLAATSYAGPGLLDSTFAPTLDGPVYSAVVQPDRRILIAGNFTKVNGITRNRLARLYPDGSLDASFMATGTGISGAIFCLSVQKDGLIIIGGDIALVNGTARTRVARLNPNGSVDGSFVPTNTISGSVLALVAQSDNKLIIGGSFAGANFPKWNARLNANGTLDTAFSSYPNGAVNAMAIQTDGKTMIGGAFTTVNGAPRNRIARLNPDGSLDNSFQNGLAGASGLVRCLQIQADGKILIGGDFTSVNNTARSSIARLNSNGSLDTGFASSASANGPVYAVVVQPDNSIVIAGGFSAYAGYNLSRVARLYGDGTRDPAFSTFGINNLVQALAVQSDGAILTGGIFTSINTTNRSFLGRLYGDLYPPEFVSQPASRATNVGATVTFTVRVNNPTPSEFQWRKDGINISGATGMSYTLYGVQFADAGIYSVFVHNAVGGIASSNAVLNVGIAPAITGQPVSLIVTQGQSATFSVVATGTPLNYFWKKDGSFITGATNSPYTITSVVASNAATYACQVSNFLGSVTSTGATLAVYSPPTIKVQPISQTVGVGSNFTVSVTATGNPAPACQWSKDGSDILGATNSSYTVTGAQTNNAGGYSLVLSNIFGVVTSSMAQVNVGYAPLIVQQPQPFTNNIGTSNAFSVVVSGSAPLVYQWFKDGISIANATNNLLPLSNLQSNQVGYYFVTVTNIYGWAISSNALLSIPGIPFRPWLWQGLVAYYPFNGNAKDDSGNALDCVATNVAPAMDRFGNAGASFHLNGTNSVIMRGETGFDIGWQQYSICLWMASDGNQQYQGLFNTIPHNGLYFVYNHPPNTNLISTCVGNGWGGWVVNIDPGTKSDFLFQKWYQVVLVKNGTRYTCYVDAKLDNTLEVPSATGFSCPSGWRIGSINNTIDGQVFRGRLDDVRIYNRALSSNEVAQLYSYEADMPIITVQPQNQSVAQRGTAIFSVAATAANPLNYQWFKDGMVLAGATNTTLNLSNAQPNQIGYYSVTVSNAVTGVVSGNAELSVSGQDPALWQGLLSYYPFAGNANDVAGTNNGTVVGATLATDRFGNANRAYSFNGTTYIQCPDTGFPSGNSPRTVCLWLNIASFMGVQITYPFGYGVYRPGSPFYSIVDNVNAGAPTIAVGTAGLGDSPRWHGPTTNVWYHIAITYSNSTACLYVNGSNVGQASHSYSTTLTGNFFIGGNFMASLGPPSFFGAISDVRIYNRALSSGELAHLFTYEADLPIITSQPQSTIMTQGRPVSFGVTASAQTPITYQWNKDGFPISAATNATLLIPNVQPSQAGLYTVAISNAFTGLVSAQAALAVMSSSGAGAPGFTSNQFGFGISGAEGNPFVVEASTNLIDWRPIATNTFGSGMFLFLDPASQTNTMGFYRLRLRGLPAPANMVWIPAGTFTMGSPETEKDRDSDEGPQTQVTFTDYFWMGKYEVTQGEYLAVMSNNPSYFTGDANRPVERVTWSNATNYCAKLTVRERAVGRLPGGYVYRLPTEAEWEYACRAGTTTQFSWGDDPGYTLLGDYAWYGPNSGGVAGFITNPVGLKLPNPWGLYDMTGNVWEWCWDWGDSSLPGGSVTNPVGPVSGASRILRGGWWSDPGGAICRSASRNGSGGTLSCFGFRVVLAKP